MPVFVKDYFAVARTSHASMGAETKWLC